MLKLFYKYKFSIKNFIPKWIFFVVVSENHFGGENKFIRAFSSKENAINYLKKINNSIKEMFLLLTMKLDSEELPEQEEANFEGYGEDTN